MIYKPNQMLKEIGSFMSLENGDIIMSGTPKGVGYYKIDDIFIGKIYNKNMLILEINWQVKLQPQN
jgi:2-keto-4-pentenoate hydratase/2-oxohepta-3-ene-1,7-dioic acid hydratase in catechol pathway